MWWEILPSAGVIVVCFALPPFVFKGLNWIFLGKPVQRWLVESEFNVDMFKRDERLTGWAFNTAGLEAVMDLEEEPEEKKEFSYIKPESFSLTSIREAFNRQMEEKEKEQEEPKQEPEEKTKEK